MQKGGQKGRRAEEEKKRRGSYLHRVECNNRTCRMDLRLHHIHYSLHTCTCIVILNCVGEMDR